MEEWRDIPGYEGLYQICIDTPEGRCRSLNYGNTGEVKELTRNPNKRDGRIQWNLYKNKKAITYQAARWIAITYPELVENEYFEGAEIDHKDTNPLNNHPFNLRWVTGEGNMNNPLTRKHCSEVHTGVARGPHCEETKRKIGDSNAKSVCQYSLDGTLIKTYKGAAHAGRETGINFRNISACCLGTQKTAGGFIWRYLESV